LGSQILQNENLREQHPDNDVSEAKSLVSANPKVALENQVIAGLFRHYIDFLAPWYDLNDSQALFGTLVPQRAMSNPILFKAVIAFSACHESRTSGRYQALGHVYHAACVRDLLEVLNDIHIEMQGDYLAATCLLRSYEILNGEFC
jgi:Fungal specific transcription factor domain